MQTRAGNFSSRRYWRINSSAGWDTVKKQAYLTEMIQEFQRNGIRTSIFVDPRLDMIEGAKQTVDRIELY
jgi:pyridoxine 5-phosphate synthase